MDNDIKQLEVDEEGRSENGSEYLTCCGRDDEASTIGKRELLIIGLLSIPFLAVLVSLPLQFI
jgi:hypothetical protein